MNDRFQIVGARPLPEAAPTKNRHSLRGKPVASAMILSLIALGCLFCELIMTKDPTYLDLAHCSAVPCREFLFGTDTMGRDIFSMIWYGGRLSLFIGVGSTVISTLLAILFGTVSGLAPKWLDALLMRLTEILLSVPNLLLVIFLQAVIGTPSAWSIALVIGLTSWTSIAKVVRTEVRQLRVSEYVIAAKCMGGSFFHILRCHLAPNFFSSILFMVVMNVRSAIIAESTLSFMGLGLPIEVVTWGSMLSLAEKGADDRRVVDPAHPRRISGRDAPLHHDPRRLPAQPHEQKRKQPVNSKKKAQPLGCAFLFLRIIFRLRSS